MSVPNPLDFFSDRNTHRNTSSVPNCGTQASLLTTADCGERSELFREVRNGGCSECSEPLREKIGGTLAKLEGA